MKDAGSFADALITLEGTIAVKPANLSFEETATLPTVAQIAWQALVEVGHLKAGQRVLINGCLGSVGRSAVQIARSLQAEVHGTCSGSGLMEARSLGVTDPVDYTAFQPRKYRNKFDVILDASGNLSVGHCSAMLRGKVIATHISPTFLKMIRTVISPRNKLVFLKNNANRLAKVAKMAAQGELTVPIGKTVPLIGAIAAINDLEQTGLPKAKLVVTPD